MCSPLEEQTRTRGLGDGGQRSGGSQAATSGAERSVPCPDRLQLLDGGARAPAIAPPQPDRRTHVRRAATRRNNRIGLGRRVWTRRHDDRVALDEAALPVVRHQSGRLLSLTRIADTGIAVIALLAGFVAANLGHMPSGLQEFLELRLTMTNVLLVAGYAVVWRLICISFGLYGANLVGDRRAEVRRVLSAATVGSMVAFIFPLRSDSHSFGPLAILYFWLGSTASMLGFRAGLRALANSRSPKVQDVLIVGSGPRALRLHRALDGSRPVDYRCLGFVDRVTYDPEPEIHDRLLGDLTGLEGILMRRAVDLVLIALPVRSCYGDIQRALEICERVGVPATYLTDVFQHRRSGGQRLAANPLTDGLSGVHSDDGRAVVKRCLDVVLGGLLLAAASPVLAAAALAIKLSSPGPAVFVQERYGLNKRRFRMYKLRTMVADAEAQQADLEVRNEASGPVFKIREDPRVTRVGRVLRQLSIDELPQLVNVIQGDMSLVGPRPLPIRDVGRFAEPWLMRRFSVRPGLTCLWQISGRSEIGFEQWITLDLEYIDRWSLLLDTAILLKTIPVVLRGRGAV
jgi:exopolysaccharide biosynthesis polyprenyl glycosylphosphotransferase